MAKQVLQWDKRSAEINARRVLPQLVAEYFDGVRKFLKKDHEPVEYHRVRLASKHLRYTLELFGPCYGKALEERIEALREVQNLLGDLNDAVATRALLNGKVDKEVRKYLKDRAEDKAKDFRKHWKEQFDAEGKEKWWTEGLRLRTRKRQFPPASRFSIKARSIGQ
jgi:CHAD domain-containing protein